MPTEPMPCEGAMQAEHAEQGVRGTNLEHSTAGASANQTAGQPAAQAAHAAAPASSGTPALESLAYELMGHAFALGRLKPSRKVSESSRGLPAVMAELLMSNEPLSPGELARRTGVTDARIANSLKVLEERGFIERHASSVDKRRVEVVLTPQGLEKAQAHRHEAMAFMADFLGELGEDDARELVRLVGRVVEVTQRRREEGRVYGPEHRCDILEKGECGEDR